VSDLQRHKFVEGISRAILFGVRHLGPRNSRPRISGTPRLTPNLFADQVARVFFVLEAVVPEEFGIGDQRMA